MNYGEVWLWRVRSKCFSLHSLQSYGWNGWHKSQCQSDTPDTWCAVTWANCWNSLFYAMFWNGKQSDVWTQQKWLQIRAVKIPIERFDHFKFKFNFSADTNINALKESNRMKWKQKWVEWISGKVSHNEREKMRRTDKRLLWFSTESQHWRNRLRCLFIRFNCDLKELDDQSASISL